LSPARNPSRSNEAVFNFKTKQNMKLDNMEERIQTVRGDVGTLAEDARALLTATADVAGEKVGEARRRLAAALESGQELCGRVRDKAVAGAKATDEAVREHPYRAIGIALGVGALVGFLFARRCGDRD
jgi:ElaB/YqjD/DUF883 family membrane-anchored ribosome-binding protein